METEVWAKFDTEFGAEPPLRPAQDVLADGRRALRRRRVAVGAGAFAAAAVAAVALGQLTGDPTGSVEPADQPSPTPTRTLSSAALAEQKLTAAVPVDTSWQQECGGAAQPTCEAYQEDLTVIGLRPDGVLARVSDDVIVSQRHDIDSGTTSPIYVVEVRSATTNAMWFVVSRNLDGRAVIRRADPSQSQIDFQTFADGLDADQSPSGTPPLSRETSPFGQ